MAARGRGAPEPPPRSPLERVLSAPGDALSALARSPLGQGAASARYFMEAHPAVAAIQPRAEWLERSLRSMLAEAGLVAEGNAARLGGGGAMRAPPARPSADRLRAELAAERARHDRAAAAAAREAEAAAAALAAAELARAKAQAAEAAEAVARAAKAVERSGSGGGGGPVFPKALLFGSRAPAPPPAATPRRRRKSSRGSAKERGAPSVRGRDAAAHDSGVSASATPSLHLSLTLPLAWCRTTLLCPAGAPAWRVGAAGAGADAAAVLAPEGAAARAALLLGLLPPPAPAPGRLPPPLPPRPAWIDADLRSPCTGVPRLHGGRRRSSAAAGVPSRASASGLPLLRLSFAWELSFGGPYGIVLTPCAAAASVALAGPGGSCAANVAAADCSAATQRNRAPPHAPLVPLLAPVRMTLLIMLAALRSVFPARAAAPSRRARLLEFARDVEAAALSPRRANLLQHAARSSYDAGGGDARSPRSGPASPRAGGSRGAHALSPRDRTGSGAAGAAAEAAAAYQRAAAKAAAAAEALAAARATSRTLSPRGGSAVASGAASGVASPSVASPRSNIAFWRRRDSSVAAAAAAAAAAASASAPAAAPAAAAEVPAWRAAAAAAAAKRAARSNGGGGVASPPTLSPRLGHSPALSPEASYEMALAAEAPVALRSAAIAAATAAMQQPAAQAQAQQSTKAQASQPQKSVGNGSAPLPPPSAAVAAVAAPKSKSRAAASQPVASSRPPPLVTPPVVAAPAAAAPAAQAQAVPPAALDGAAVSTAKGAAAFWRQTSRDAPPLAPPPTSPGAQPGARFSTSGTVAAPAAARRSSSTPTPTPAAAPPPPPPPASGDAKTALLAELYSAELQMEQISYELGRASAATPSPATAATAAPAAAKTGGSKAKGARK